MINQMSEASKAQQRRLFETFGFITLPGVLRDEIHWIEEEFARVFTDKAVRHDGSQRSCIVPFIDQRERLCSLLDYPALHDTAANLIGDDFNYIGSDGNYYTGDTAWHSDGFHHVGTYIKIAIYLDPVTRDSGCLRVIPGSHRLDAKNSWQARQAAQASELWGIEQSEVPCVALESQPGDVVIFNHNLMHAAFGGSTQRRMFTLNLCRHCQSDEEIQELKNYIGVNARFWIDRMHSDIMRATANQSRQLHLQQVIEHEGHLAALSAKARAEMSEPSRG